MKQLTPFMRALALATILSLNGCGKDEGDGGAPKSDERKTEQTGKTEEPRPADPSQAPPAPAIKSGIAECDAYMATYVKFMQCDKVPQEAKDGFQKQFEGTKQSWNTLSDPATPSQVRKQYVEICKQGEATIRQNAPLLGCSL